MKESKIDEEKFSEIKPYIIVYHCLNDAVKSTTLTDLDVLVYACLRKFMKKETNQADSSYTQIADIAGISLGTVKTAILRLEKCGFITSMQRMNKSKIYTFIRLEEHFESFHFTLIENKTYSPQLKAFLLIVRKLLTQKDGVLMLSTSQKDLAKDTGLSLNTIKRRIDELDRCEGVTYVHTPRVLKGNDYHGRAIVPVNFGLMFPEECALIKEHDTLLHEVIQKLKDFEKKFDDKVETRVKEEMAEFKRLNGPQLFVV